MQEKDKKKKSENDAHYADCSSCLYYIYDEDYEEYMCTMYLDEDDIIRLQMRKNPTCPYYRNGDEYLTVRKQN